MMGPRIVIRPSHSLSEKAGDHGFTLLELLVVIAILGLLVAFVAPAALRQLGYAKISVAKQDLQRLDSVLGTYKLGVGDFPSTQQGLQALLVKPPEVDDWTGPYVQSAQNLKDPWGHLWLYTYPSARGSGHDYDLCSAGPSGKGTGPDSSDAICNP